MTTTRLSGRTLLLPLGLLALCAAVLAALALAPSPAQSAFPGANGKIAFDSDRDGNWEIYVMNADGSGQTNLTNDPAADTFPDWQPLVPPPGPPAVGGIVELRSGASEPAAAGPGSSGRDYFAPVAVAVAAGAIALGAGGWWARRRWLR